MQKIIKMMPAHQTLSSLGTNLAYHFKKTKRKEEKATVARSLLTMAELSSGRYLPVRPYLSNRPPARATHTTANI